MTYAARLRPLTLRALRLFFTAFLAGFLLFLPFAGRFFNAQDELQHADLIMVLAGARIERWLEAVDLYKEGWGPRIVVSPGPVEPIEAELERRGVRYPRDGELARAAIVGLGVPADQVTVLPQGVDNTAAEAAALHRMLPPTGVRRLIVVTSPYHLRRAGYAFRRELRGTGVQVVMRGTRYSRSRPTRWWTRRGDIRFIMAELPKFIAYVGGLGE